MLRETCLLASCTQGTEGEPNSPISCSSWSGHSSVMAGTLVAGMSRRHYMAATPHLLVKFVRPPKRGAPATLAASSRVHFRTII